MDENTLHALLASHLQVTPARLKIAPAKEGSFNLFLEGHNFPLATIKPGEKTVTVTRTNHHPVMDEEGLFHHVTGRAAWQADLAEHEDRLAHLQRLSPQTQDDHDVVEFHTAKTQQKIQTAVSTHEGRTTGGGGGLLHIPLA